MFFYEFEVHLQQNITANNYILANAIPVKRIMPEIISILWAYNKVFVIYFFVLLAIFFYKYLTTRFVKKVTKSETDVNKKVLFILIFMLILYYVLMANTGYFSVARCI